MLGFHVLRRFNTKRASLSHLFNCSRFYISQKDPRLERYEQKKFTKATKRKIEQHVKDETPKIYTRETVNQITKILRFSTWDSAQEQLEELSVKWDSYTINQVLKSHPPMEKAWLFFNWTSRLRGFKHDQYTYTTMLDIFGEAGRISSMKYLFRQMQEKDIKIDVVTYTSLMHWLSNHGDLVEALDVWQEMRAKGFLPTVVSYTAFMKVLFDNNRPKEASSIYKEMLECGCSPNCHTYTVLMEYLAEAGNFEAALEILNKMQDAGIKPDKAACNILVHKCSKAGQIFVMVQILQYMKENFIVLRYPIYMEALEAVRIAGESDQLLREVNPHLSSEQTIINTSNIEETTSSIFFEIDKGIIQNLLAREDFVAIWYILNISSNIPLDSRILSDIILSSCAKYKLHIALMAFDHSLKVGTKVERAAYLALIGLHIRNKSLEKVEEIVDVMIKEGIALGSYLASLLIWKLGSSGMLASSLKIFNTLCDAQSGLFYTALISVYIKRGNIDEALYLYTCMIRKGIPALLGTYEVLIRGLREAGRTLESNIYIKKKRSLQSSNCSLQIFSMEDNLCNLLFDGN